MSWLLCGAIPLLVILIRVFAREPKSWFAAVAIAAVIAGLAWVAVYGAYELGWLRAA